MKLKQLLPFIGGALALLTVAATNTLLAPGDLKVNGKSYFVDTTRHYNGLKLGSSGDVNLYRGAANFLYTDDSVLVGGLAGSGNRILAVRSNGRFFDTAISVFGGFANPSATLGLTAVNGSATTAMRSDAAPALSQAIAPTWTGTHTFTLAPVFSSVLPGTVLGVDGSNVLTNYFFTGTGNVVAADNASMNSPTINALFLTGTTSSTGKISTTDSLTAEAGLRLGGVAASNVVLARSGANMLTIYDSTTIAGLAGSGNRAVGVRSDGRMFDTAFSSFAGLADPSATIGLSAVNGSASTAMRSDAAPALSQAIVPTWTGLHTFHGNAFFDSTDTAFFSRTAASMRTGGRINYLGDMLTIANDSNAGETDGRIELINAQGRLLLDENGSIGVTTGTLGLYPIITDNVALGGSANRWLQLYSQVGNFTGTITSTASGSGSSSAFYLSSTTPTLTISASGAGSDEKTWDIQGTATTLDFRTRTDAFASGVTWLSVGPRSGTSVTAATFLPKILGADTIAAQLGFRAGSTAASNVNWNRASANLWNTPDSVNIQGKLFVGDTSVSDTVLVRVKNLDTSNVSSHAKVEIVGGSKTNSSNQAGNAVLQLRGANGFYNLKQRRLNSRSTLALEDGVRNYFVIDSVNGIAQNKTNFSLDSVIVTTGPLTIGAAASLADFNVTNDTIALNGQLTHTATVKRRSSLTVSSNLIAVDAALSDFYSVTLNANATLSNPTNSKEGRHFTIRVTQDGTGGRTLAFGTNYRFPGGTAPTMTATATNADYYSFFYNEANSTWDYVGASQNLAP